MDTPDNLVSWVDPFDMPVKRTVPTSGFNAESQPSTAVFASRDSVLATSGAGDSSDKINEIVADLEVARQFQQSINSLQVQDTARLTAVLNELGVTSSKDLKYVTDQDLIASGIATVTARKLLAQTSKAPSPAVAATVTGLFSAEDTMKALAKKGGISASRSTGQMFASSFLGGALLGWGCALTTVVAGGTAAALINAPGLLSLLTGMVFPVGLSMVLLSGSELLTGNFTTMALPAFTHSAMLQSQVIANTVRVWGISGAGNLAGSLFLASTVYSLSVVVPGSPAAAWLVALTVKKCSLPILVATGKGACANWLVNVAIFQAASAHTTAGKIASLWLPIMTFVTLGLEHSIANMFLLPLGMVLGADVTVLDILGNWVPVLVGNAIGAIVFVTGVQRYSLIRNFVYSKAVR